jgi:hypothetical protein
VQHAIDLDNNVPVKAIKEIKARVAASSAAEKMVDRLLVTEAPTPLLPLSISGGPSATFMELLHILLQSIETVLQNSLLLFDRYDITLSDLPEKDAAKLVLSCHDAQVRSCWWVFPSVAALTNRIFFFIVCLSRSRQAHLRTISFVSAVSLFSSPS